VSRVLGHDLVTGLRLEINVIKSQFHHGKLSPARPLGF
jgi:hypothetical protein